MPNAPSSAAVEVAETTMLPEEAMKLIDDTLWRLGQMKDEPTVNPQELDTLKSNITRVVIWVRNLATEDRIMIIKITQALEDIEAVTYKYTNQEDDGTISNIRRSFLGAIKDIRAMFRDIILRIYTNPSA